ncbi:4-hydroxy-tetrahydrodipicolinate reductase [Halobacteriaceae archaeon GCM10025711]
MRLAVTGATGRMGRTVVAAAGDRGHDVVLAVNRDPGDETVAGVPVEAADDLPALLADRDPDALVDFTGPESSVAYVEACADAGVPTVVGTTGFDESQAAALRAASERAPVLRAANFARGVQALLRVVEEAVRALPGYDVEVTETHHNAKRDAPSGTAKELLARVEATGEFGDRVHGREGETPRRDGEIGVHARRAGDVTGEHEVLLAGNHELVSLTHRAESRGVFAAGALDAAGWLVDQVPGYYDFSDVVGDSA